MAYFKECNRAIAIIVAIKGTLDKLMQHASTFSNPDNYL